MQDIELDTFTVSEVYRYNLTLHEEESFNPALPQVFFAIHPPFNPINPVFEGHAIRSGFIYAVEITLEEDHLLPYPYPTNCTDYTTKMATINGAKPRSQEMCKELCRSEFFKQCIGCDMGMTMHLTTEHMCRRRYKGCHYSSLNEQELRDTPHMLTGMSTRLFKTKISVHSSENRKHTKFGKWIKE
ncbi:uncharacterized protein LOC129976753 [Argiope bruennichi]|uniref:uncharacterized protein LOC129976753 n=1 Tax=Argiope bruennichi TaxID=94029 RepID=UPI0024956C2E|nr:uncharacterized protein LOC129976753 [Argiope bruennichi]